MGRIGAAICGAVLAASLGAGVSAQGMVSTGRLVDVPLTLPSSDAEGIAILFTGADVAPAEATALRDAMVAEGLGVLEVDLDRYRTALDGSDGECLYIDGELTDLTQQALKAGGLTTYLRPVLVGIDEGATLAYAGVGQTPYNTVAGGVAVGFKGTLKTRLPFCPGEEATPGAAGFSYGTDKELISPVTFVDTVADKAVATALAGRPEAQAETGADRVALAAAAAKELAVSDKADVGGLPLTVLEPQGEAKGMAVVWSGDGGWRDIDKDIAEQMAADGYGVVGLDTLRYFWSARQPEEAAADLASVISDYSEKWKVRKVVLVGYSFGANLLPFAFPHLPGTAQHQVKSIVLLAPTPETDFAISVEGWLGVDSGAHDVVTAVAGLPKDKVMCVSSDDEDPPVCKDGRLAGYEVKMLPGGHHFDGDYAALAKMIEGFFRSKMI